MTGNIIAFPDDDCAYPHDLLLQVFQILENDAALDGVSCFVSDEHGAASAGGVMQRGEGPITRSNVWKTAVSCSFFVRRSMVESVGAFDEQLGVGADSGRWSGEETDWLLRALAQGARIVYRPRSERLSSAADFTQSGGVRKAYRYGCGAGRVLRTHRYPHWYTAASAGFQLLRALGELLRFRPRAAIARAAMGRRPVEGVSSILFADREDVQMQSSSFWRKEVERYLPFMVSLHEESQSRQE